MTTVAQYLADACAGLGIDRAFIVTGGGAMFLDDAFSHQPAITPTYCHHEQACTMAAEAYARLAGRPGLAIVTTGPGGINALNGVFGAWTDSIPMLVISGQVKRQTCLGSYDLPGLRQLGDQEADIVAIARPITKFALQVRDPLAIRRAFEQAVHIATHGRPGPCWLDIPIDVQSARIDPAQLPAWTATDAAGDTPTAAAIEAHCARILALLAAAQRPVVIAGSGVRIGQALGEFEDLIDALGVPVVTAWTHDLIAADHPLYCGRPGTIGTRAGNFTVQNADLVLVLGSRLNIRQTSYNWAGFAAGAIKVQIDIDPAELAKPTVMPDHAICCDLKPLLGRLAEKARESHVDGKRHRRWLDWCRERSDRYPSVRPAQREWRGRINPYHFVERLFEQLEGDDIVACGNATATIVPFQAGVIKRGMRMFSNSGSASMGYDLPAAIGAYFGAVAERGAQRRVICLAGDGSIMMNLQELQTIVQHRLPIKIFVLDNSGYLSIRTSQSSFFGRLAGAGPESGVGLPDFVAVATAFGIAASRLDSVDFAAQLPALLDAPGPHLCQVMLDADQQFEPRLSSRQLDDGRIVSAALEDMYPFLDRDELAGNMLRATPGAP